MIKRYYNTLIYISLILGVNLGFSFLPSFILNGQNQISLADILVGFIYLARDLAQRELGHRIIGAMLIGTLLSYVFADPLIARASAAAFIIAEIIDWSLFSLTGWSLAKRLLLSAGLSAPVDTYIFLQVAHLFNELEFFAMLLAKWLGVISLWLFWRFHSIKRVASTPDLRPIIAGEIHS